MGTSFIGLIDIYCFGTGLQISVYKDVYQYRHVNTVNVHCKSEVIVHFYLIFLSFLIKTVMF